MKITKYFLSMAAALGMIAGCQMTDMVQIAAPEDVVAPVLEAVEGPIEITPSNMVDGKVAFTWSLADFGVMTQVNYSLEAATAADPDTKVTITSGITANAEALEAGKISTEIAYEALNAILFNDLKLNDGVAEEVLFTIASKVGEYAPVYSNSVAVSCKVTAAEKQYPKLTVAGSYAYNNWTPGKGQFVFDFEGTDAKYSGVIDFGEDVSALQFKFVGSKWGENEFSVPEGETQAPEAAELPLVAGGGDNIAAYTTHRFYSLTLDKATPKLIKNFSFNQIGVIGSFNGWAADVVMNFNAEKQRFYADVEFAEDGQFKLRADADWALNWGAEAFGMTVSNGDGNLEAKAGSYRIYANMNNPAAMTIELNAGMYGKEEPVGGNTTPEPEPEPEPTPVVGWSLIGAFNGWAGDLMLTSDGTYYVIKGAELEGELKFRKDGQWNYKDEEGNEVQTNLGAAEGVTFAADEELALAPNGGNINVTAGTYDVYLDPENAKAWFITDGSYPGEEPKPEEPEFEGVASEWGIVGDVNNWGNTPGVTDVVMYTTPTEGLFVAKNAEMPDGAFKIRANNEWNDAANYGTETAGNVAVDHVYNVISSGGSCNMTLAAGTYDIWFDLNAKKVYIMTPGKDISAAVAGTPEAPKPVEGEPWYLVGNFNGWKPADANYQMTFDGTWYVFKNFAADGKGMKFVGDANYSRERVGTFTSANTAISVSKSSGDMFPTAGTYDVYLNADASKAYFMTPGTTPAN